MTQKEEIKVPYAITAYVARNKDNTLWLCYEKPSKNEYEGYWEPSADIATYIDSRFFPCVSWEDKEPLEIEVSAYFLS